MFNCSGEMAEYHTDEVVLPGTEQAEMRDRRNAGRTRLERGLERDGHPPPRETASQGSYSMRTMVKDEECDYDIDDGAYFRREALQTAEGQDVAPAAARARVRAALQQDDRLAFDAELKPNCVRQRYPQGYHIDVAVYRVFCKEGGEETYEHASGEVWRESDARAITRWFKGIVGDLASGQADGQQLRRIVRLTKKFSRSRGAPWKGKTTSGICITRLVVDEYVGAAGDDRSLRDTWVAIAERLARSTEIEHPVLDGQLLAAENDGEVAFVRGCLDEALAVLGVLDRGDCSRREARKAWDDVFNTTFFSDLPLEDPDDGNNKGSRGPFVVTSKNVARRDDGGRQYG
ncbi:MAG: cyclic GMP-AMP synthase DncV-like nucleotidyltransferase [Acidobacteriota bacterium]